MSLATELRAVDLIVNAASAFDSSLATRFVAALAKRQQISGKGTYIIHVSPSTDYETNSSDESAQSSVENTFSPEAGWPFGKVKDCEDIFEKEKSLSSSPTRDVRNAQSPTWCGLIQRSDQSQSHRTSRSKRGDQLYRPVTDCLYAYSRMLSQIGCTGAVLNRTDWELDGIGRGSWMKTSSNIPAVVRAAIKEGVIHKFDKNSVRPICHCCCCWLTHSL